MVGLVSRMNSMSARQVVGFWLVVAVIIAAGAIVYVQTRNGGDGGSAAAAGLEEGQQIVQVVRGDLVNQVSSSGSVVFPTREDVAFGASGVIGEILVAEGETVAAGQELARLDAETVVTLERAAAQAAYDLQQAQEALDALHEPPSELAAVDAATEVARAELALDRAMDALADLETPVTQEDIDDAQDAVARAEEDLAEANRDLKSVVSDHAERGAEAAEGLDAARDDYQALATKFLGLTLTDADYALTPQQFFDAYGIDLYTFYSDVQLEDAVLSLLPLEPSPDASLDRPETPWDEFVVYRWIALYPGAIHGTCAGITTGLDDVCVLQDMERSWDKLETAKTALQTAYDNADAAEDNAQKAVDAALDAVTLAQERLADLSVTADTLEVRVQSQEVELARAKLADARDTLAALDDPPDATLVALREAQVRAEETALADAEGALEHVTLKAPFGGLVNAVYVEQGRAVNGNNNTTAIMEIVDTSVAEVDARLDEIDVLSVQEGAQAIVRLDGLPGAGLPGTVRSISRSGENQSGVVTYPVQITLNIPPRLQLREGLTATADIVLQQELDVLLIPVTAIAGALAQPTVLVNVDGEVTEREVTLGASDGFWTVVESGVEEGESLVSTAGAGAAPTFQGFAGLGGLGGAAGLGQGRRQFGQGQGPPAGFTPGQGAGRARPGAGE